jgi:hypothetical protein
MNIKTHGKSFDKPNLLIKIKIFMKLAPEFLTFCLLGHLTGISIDGLTTIGLLKLHP